MMSNIHVGSRNLLIKLKEIKFWCSKNLSYRIFFSGNLQKFIQGKRKIFSSFWPHKTFYSITVQLPKLVNLNSNFFENFPCPSRMSKLLQVFLHHIYLFCNCWTLFTFSQKSVCGMLMYQVANNLKYLIGCWISHGFA